MALVVAGCGQLVMSVGGDTYGTVFDDVPTTAECESETEQNCLDANRLRERYGLDRLAADGLTGKGATVAVIDFSGADSFAEDLEEYSSRMGLPPPRLKERDVELGYEPFAEYDSSDPRMVAAAVHTSRQLQLIHTLAPQATILLERLRFPDTEKVDRPIDELLAIRLRALVNERAADVVLLGHGSAEHELSERTERVSDLLRNRRTVFDDADRQGVTVLASAGRRAAWPAVDPGVLAVGGRTGTSRIFERPDYQVNLSSLDEKDLEGRTVPDLTLPGVADDRQLIYQSVSEHPGWVAVRVSQAERMAGLVALSVQAVGDGLGKLNDDVYYLATETAGPERSGLRVRTPEPGAPGERAVVDVARFVRALADSARRPERAVPDERPKPDERCRDGNPIDYSIRNHQNVRVTPRICVRHDPAQQRLTGRITVDWRPRPGSDDSSTATRGRFDGFEIRTVLERDERDQQDRKCSIRFELNHTKRGQGSCRVTISNPEPGTWAADGRLAWDRGDRPGGWEPPRKLRGSPVLDLE